MERFKFLKLDKILELPNKPGVYAFKAGRQFLYIGKAANIKARVKNHFQQPAYRDNLFIDKAQKVGFIKTDSEIEALILEAKLIKKLQPKFNVLWKDDKNYFFVAITKEDFPRVFITHQKKIKNQKSKIKNIFIGPFVDGRSLKAASKSLRKIFPFRSCKRLPERACLWYQLNRCPAPCLLKGKLASRIPASKIHPSKFCFSKLGRVKRESKENVKNLLKILKGEKTQLLKRLEKEMKGASKKQEFEKAARIRDKIFSLNKVLVNARIFRIEKQQDWPEIEKRLKKILKTKKAIKKIEAYDVSNIQGKQATGAMVTFIRGLAEKNFYRRFKIKTIKTPNDIAMLQECLIRRFQHPEWGWPDLILIDGGIAQLNAALKVRSKKSEVRSVKVMSLAKGKKQLYLENRKKPIPLDSLANSLRFFILRIDEEAHRFAIQYHRKLRKKELISI